MTASAACSTRVVCPEGSRENIRERERRTERERDVPLKPNPIFYLWPTGSPSACPLDDTQEVSTTRSQQNTSQPDQSLTVKWGVVSRGLLLVVESVWCLLGVSFHACVFFFFSFPPSLFLSLSSSKIHQDSHRPDWSVRGCGIICVPGHWQSQAGSLLEQEGQEGQLPAYRGGCHSAQWSNSMIAAW